MLAYAAYKLLTHAKEVEAPMIYLYELHALHKRQGFGTRLMEMVKSIGQEAGMEGILLTRWEGSDNILFYDAQGFEKTKLAPADASYEIWVHKFHDELAGFS